MSDHTRFVLRYLWVLAVCGTTLMASLNETPIVGLHKEVQTIFVHPLEEDDPQLQAAIREILSREQGQVSYRFRDKQRTIVYRKSPVTGWWYGFGVLGQ